MRTYGDDWVAAVCRVVDPVMASAGVDFTPGRGNNGTILWEATPSLFLAAYPDCDLVSAYGGAERWPEVHCLDYWVTAEPERELLRLTVEGWNLPEVCLEAGSHIRDGANVARIFARILRLPPPEF